MGVGGELGGAAAGMRRRRQRIEKHGGRLAVECGRRMWVSVAGWEVRRPWSGGSGSVLKTRRAVGCGMREADVGSGGRLGGAAALKWRRRLRGGGGGSIL